MVQGYYTLEESAHILGMAADELKQLAHKGEIRSFQDRGTWRFRIQDIQEMARRRTGGSDLELAVGESLTPKPTDSPAPRSPKPHKKTDDVFSLAPDDDAHVNLGADVQADAASGSSSGKKSGSSKRRTQAATDSDIRLVAEGSDIAFSVPTDSDVKVGGDKSGPRSSKTGLAGPRSSKVGKSKPETPPAAKADSGIRLVPDSDSDVRLLGADDDSTIPLAQHQSKGATDSAVRLEGLIPLAPEGAQGGQLTEEINLDEELEKQEQAERDQQHAQPDFPKKSPFDLSQSELNLSPLEHDAPVQSNDSSSDFELTPAAESSSPIELGSSDDFKVVEDDDMVTLGDDSDSSQKGPLSGINLGHPADSGISLEQQGDSASDEFELTLESEPTPKPAKPAKSSKQAPSKPAPAKQAEEDDSDSSEFELSLDADEAAVSDSDSEFELTLDDTGGLADLEDAGDKGQDKDIFETDFDVPGLEDESGSEAVAVEDAETDLASSDFEIGIDDMDAGVEDESGSVVVPIDEDEPISGRKGGKKRAQVAVDDAGEYADLDEGGAEDDIVVEEEEEEAVLPMVMVQQAPWGVMPVAVLLPCVIVMVLLGMMGFELIQSQQGYKQGMLTKAISGLVDGKK